MTEEKENKESIHKEWLKRESRLKTIAIFIVVKEVLDIVVNLFALTGVGVIVTVVYNFIIGTIVTIGMAFTSFSGKFSNKKALAKKVIRLVVSFVGEAFLSFLPLDVIVIAWIWFDEKKEYEAKMSGKEHKQGLIGGWGSKLVDKAAKVDTHVLKATGWAGVVSNLAVGNTTAAAEFIGRKGVIKIANKISNRRNEEQSQQVSERGEMKSSYDDIIE